MTDPSYGTRAASSPAIPHRPFAVVVLAAGEGTRMKSTRPKVLHGFAGRSLLGHVLAACAPLDAEHTIVVVGHHRDDVQAHLDLTGQPVTTVVQEEQHGTGHAVRIAMEALPPEEGGTIVVLPGDTPLLQPSCLLALLTEHHRSRRRRHCAYKRPRRPDRIRTSHSRWGARRADRRAERTQVPGACSQ